jgi:formate dehydrogenase maturation protein FdhE
MHDRSAFEPDPTRRAFCPSCKSKTQTITQRNRDGHLYCRCLTCACRFRF